MKDHKLIKDYTGKYEVTKLFRMSEGSKKLLDRLFLKVIEKEGEVMTQAACFEKLVGKLAELELSNK